MHLAELVYILGAASTVLCSVLLLRQYRVGRQPLLLWSGLCFAGLTVTNVLIFLDLAVFLDVDLHYWRLSVAAISLCLLVLGLVWEKK
jgi:hypothetical protein